VPLRLTVQGFGPKIFFVLAFCPAQHLCVINNLMDDDTLKQLLRINDQRLTPKANGR
jgi:hypothetical protein